MWKYECKKHLLYTLLAMFAGAILFGVFGFGKEAIILAIETMEETTGMASDQLLILVENSLYLATFGAFYIGGFVNGLMLMFALIRRFNLSSFVMLAIFLLDGDIILLVGATFTKSFAKEVPDAVNKIKTNDCFSYAAKVWYFLGSDEVLNGTGDLIKQALSEKEDDDEFISINRDDLDNLRNNRKKTFEQKMQLYSFDNFQKAIRIKKDIVSLVDKMF